jgi:peroxiredoxin Q/BCP
MDHLAKTFSACTVTASGLLASAVVALLALAGPAAVAAPAASAASAASAAPEAGQAAPAFRLQDQTGEWRSLADYRGKWVVLYFYPKDGTPGCTTQACEIRDDIFAFRRANAAVLGVSVDAVNSKKGFAEENNLPFPVLSDTTTTTTKAYGALTSYPQYKLFNISRRDTFIIDPQGRIARRYENVNAEGHSKMVLAELAKLQK